MKSTEKKLSLKQLRFCDWYAKLANGTQAAIRAGYSQKTATMQASRLLTKANVKARVADRLKHLEELIGFNKATVIEDLHAIKNMSMRAVPVMKYDARSKSMKQMVDYNEDGEEVGVFEFDSNGANRAIENINKMMGYNEPDKVEDVTPLDKKQPAVIIVEKSYASESDNKPTPETN